MIFRNESLAVIDLDGVVADVAAAIWKFLSGSAFCDLLPAKKEFLLEADSVMRARAEIFGPVWQDPRFWFSVPPYLTNISALKWWVEEGRGRNRAIFLTSRPAMIADVTRDWLKRHGLGAAGVWFGRKPSTASQLRVFLPGCCEKREIFADLLSTHGVARAGFIDDWPGHVKAVRQLAKPAVLLARPWNRPWRMVSAFRYPGIITVRTLAEFLKLVDLQRPAKQTPSGSADSFWKMYA